MGTMSRNRRVGITLTLILLILACALIVSLGWCDGDEPEERGRIRTSSGTRPPADTTIRDADAGDPPVGRSPEEVLAYFRDRLEALAGGDGPEGTSSIVGEVLLEENGRPCADVSVFLVPYVLDYWSLLRDLHPDAPDCSSTPAGRLPDADGRTVSPRPRMAESGQDGTFAIHALAAGRYVLIAHPVGHPSVLIREIFVGVGREVRVEVRLPEGLTLRGRVTDVTSGKPVAGARVSVSRSIWLSAVTDGAGDYEIRGLPYFYGTPWPALVFAAGYPAHEFRNILRTEGNYTGDFAIARGTDIRGRVVDPDGHGIQGARVAPSLDGVMGRADHERPWTRAVKTDEKGAFHLRDLPRGQAFVIWANADGYASAASPPCGIGVDPSSGFDTFEDPEVSLTRAEHDVSDVVLTLRPVGRVRLRVVDEKGQPVEGAEIEGYQRIEHDFTMTYDLMRSATGHPGLEEVATLPAGRYDLTVGAEGLLTETVRLDVLAGETITREVVLTRGASITGQVLDVSSEPVANCPVLTWPADELPVECYFPSSGDCTSSQGRFELTGLESGREYVICAVPNANPMAETNADLGVSAPLRVRAGQQGVILRTRHASVLRLRIVDDNSGKPISHVFVGIRAEGDQTSFADWVRPLSEFKYHESYTRDGRITFEGVPPGRYAFEVMPRCVVVATPRTVEIPDDGSPVELEVRMDPGRDRIFSGSVIWDDGTPAAGVRIGLVGDDPLVHLRSIVTDHKGEFETRRVPAGHRPLVLSGTTPATIWLLQWDDATIGSNGERRTIKLGSRGRGAICVRTLEEAGRAVPGARVTLRDATGKVLATGAGLPDDLVRRCRATLEARREISPLFHRISANLTLGASITGETGLLMRGSLLPGPVEIEVEATGYETLRTRATIRSGRKIYREIVLVRER
jgi:protocatechuate 3,4-dioxygenase beta subunit